MGIQKESLRTRAGAVFNGAMMVGAVALIVAKGLASNPASELKHQREHGFLNADFWRS